MTSLVDIEHDLCRRPFHGIKMIVALCRFTHICNPFDGGATIVIGLAMDGGMDARSIKAHILHDVQLAAGGPVGSADGIIQNAGHTPCLWAA